MLIRRFFKSGKNVQCNGVLDSESFIFRMFFFFFFAYFNK